MFDMCIPELVALSHTGLALTVIQIFSKGGMMAYLGWLLLGLILGVAISFPVLKAFRRKTSHQDSVVPLLKSHFHPSPIGAITITERTFPMRVRADLQIAIDQLFGEGITVRHFCGVRGEFSHHGVNLSDCLIENRHSATVTIPPEYEEVNVGVEQPVRVLKIGLWLLEKEAIRFAAFLTPAGHYGQVTGVKLQVGTPNTTQGTKIAQEYFSHLEKAIQQARSYRGKVLSLEQQEHSYSGESKGITVHQLREVTRDQVILPAATLELLERNVIQFVKQRERLSQFKQSTKKGILFYGPPGTGKTHTIHYLSRTLPGHTTLLISAEQVGMLDEYMTLARLLQPSIVVLEDVDLIARDRNHMESPCEEVLLNKLLNEMDGLKPEAEILFILTTNRPETLEAALASRPGRVDQAIEFPLPDTEGRRKLIHLYSEGVTVGAEVIDDVLRRTAGVSAAFIKELMRRAVQFHLEREGTGEISSADVTNAMDEMLVSGGSLNLKLLGATGVTV
ncbi:ATP-dependent zinc metalloprotease FtsH 3 [Gimesia maris]|uniref:AAA family ATPase n=1 Tax=Gimesia maris TaxID=122 RepID=UPI001188BECB|nr:ATP-binding protein [Gimesia maris]QDT80620.1 ATP-dependent zinc metalloprotease FtsH 3 [Gimesia maris]